MKATRLLVVLLLLLSLTGCASVSLVKSWREQPVMVTSYRDFLVVGISSNRQMRQVVEEVLAAELIKKGLSATPSYTITGVETKLTRELILKAVQTSNVDAVITTRLVDLKKDTRTESGFVMTDRGVDTYFDMYGTGTVSYATFDMKPVEVTTSTTYALETNLFDTKTEHLVWAGITDAVDPQGVIMVSQQFSTIVINELSKEGLIQ